MAYQACYGLLLPATRRFTGFMVDDAGEFRAWLQAAMDRRGITKQSAFAAAAGVAQSTVSSYLSGTRTPEKRHQVEKLVQALLPRDPDPQVADLLLNAGLLAAGLAPKREITYELDPDALALAEGYNGLPDMARRIVDSAYKSASELALAMDREGVKGKRAED